mgnify:FL=1
MKVFNCWLIKNKGLKFLLALIVGLLLSCLGLAQDVEVLPRKNQGLFNITEVGYLPGVGNISRDGAFEVNEGHGYRISTVFGYFFTPRISAGIGVGLDGYQEPSHSVFPVFADFRGYLNDARNTAYVFADLGHAFNLGEGFEQGMFFNFGAGYKFFVTEAICLNASIGYNYQHLNPEQLYVDDAFNIGFHVKTPTNMKALSVEVGMVFQLWRLEGLERGLTDEPLLPY